MNDGSVNRSRVVTAALTLAVVTAVASGSLGGTTNEPAHAVPADRPWRTLAGALRDGPATEVFLRDLIHRHDVTALSVAVVDAGETVFARTLGVVDRAIGKPAGASTVFRAASLTKPIFAYLVMKLVDEGVLDLDAPVHRYLRKPLHEYGAYASLRGDPRQEHLTARLLLSHQGGLPNWRRIRPDGPIAFDSNPGERFAYSGEGYCLLQFVIEEATGRALHTLAHDKVFVPLGMNDTSFLWEPRFDGRFAIELPGGFGRLIEATRWKANAAASVVTNASDYARFVAAIVNGAGLKPGTRAAMLAPQVALTSQSLFSAPGTDAGRNRAHQMAWALGWGTFTDAHGRALFHVGREEGCESYAQVFLDRGLGIVILGATRGPDSFSATVVDYVLGKAFSPLDWLEYGTPAFLNPLDAVRRYIPVAVAATAIATAVVAVILQTVRSRSRRRRLSVQ